MDEDPPKASLTLHPTEHEREQCDKGDSRRRFAQRMSWTRENLETLKRVHSSLEDFHSKVSETVESLISFICKNSCERSKIPDDMRQPTPTKLLECSRDIRIQDDQFEYLARGMTCIAWQKLAVSLHWLLRKVAIALTALNQCPLGRLEVSDLVAPISDDEELKVFFEREHVVHSRHAMILAIAKMVQDDHLDAILTAYSQCLELGDLKTAPDWIFMDVEERRKEIGSTLIVIMSLAESPDNLHSPILNEKLDHLICQLLMTPIIRLTADSKDMRDSLGTLQNILSLDPYYSKSLVVPPPSSG